MRQDRRGGERLAGVAGGERRACGGVSVAGVVGQVPLVGFLHHQHRHRALWERHVRVDHQQPVRGELHPPHAGRHRQAGRRHPGATAAFGIQTIAQGKDVLHGLNGNDVVVQSAVVDADHHADDVLQPHGAPVELEPAARLEAVGRAINLEPYLHQRVAENRQVAGRQARRQLITGDALVGHVHRDELLVVHLEQAQVLRLRRPLRGIAVLRPDDVDLVGGLVKARARVGFQLADAVLVEHRQGVDGRLAQLAVQLQLPLAGQHVDEHGGVDVRQDVVTDGRQRLAAIPHQRQAEALVVEHLGGVEEGGDVDVEDTGTQPPDLLHQQLVEHLGRVGLAVDVVVRGTQQVGQALHLGRPLLDVLRVADVAAPPHQSRRATVSRHPRADLRAQVTVLALGRAARAPVEVTLQAALAVLAAEQLGLVDGAAPRRERPSPDHLVLAHQLQQLDLAVANTEGHVHADVILVARSVFLVLKYALDLLLDGLDLQSTPPG